MTSSEMPTRIAMPMPFASGASATRATIESVSGDNLNYVDGFPGKYSLPASEGGKYVSRGEMNAIGNMASNDLHYFKCGGLNSFDAAFCAAVGGYPKGAVLDYIVGYKLYKVISLVDGNMIDFTASGVDGVNWQYLNLQTVDPSRATAFSCTITERTEGGPIGVFKAEKDSDTWLLDSSLQKTYLQETNTEITYLSANDTSESVICGGSILIKDLGTSSDTSSATLPSATIAYTHAYAKDGVYNQSKFAYSYNDNGWALLYGGMSVFKLATSYASDPANVISSHGLTCDIGQAHFQTLNFSGLKAGHYYLVMAFSGGERFRDYNIDSFEQLATDVTAKATVSYKPFVISGKFTIYY